MSTPFTSGDAFIDAELSSATTVNSCRNILCQASGSPGDWASAPFVDGPDSDSRILFRTSKVELATDVSRTGVTVVAAERLLVEEQSQDKLVSA